MFIQRMCRQVAGLVFAITLASAQGPGSGDSLVFHGPPPGAPMEFLSIAMGLAAETVKSAPYSADASTESTQTLSDGNRISRKTSTVLYRDSEGRTRREQSMQAFGPDAAAGTARSTAFIHDPVAGVDYILNLTDKTATRITRPQGAGDRPARPEPPANPNARTEQLGKQVMQGVEAEGTRTTTTIAAGQIGNERAITIVSERWYSPELQIPLLTRHTDPRTGQTLYQVTRLLRTEPARTLFSVPSDFTITDGPAAGGRRFPGPPNR